jgi:hypothetical protein
LSGQATELNEVVSELANLVYGHGGAPLKFEEPTEKHKQKSKNHGKVVEFKKRSSPQSLTKDSHQSEPLKKASGSEEVPSNNDPRFEDV